MSYKPVGLPYSKDALEPFISKRTVEVHYDDHHRGYCDKLTNALRDDPRADLSLTDLVERAEGKVFDLAAQVWNHNFYWQSMSPSATKPRSDGPLQALIEASFDGHEAFVEKFADAANGEFGSGWAWLVYDPREKKLQAMSTSDAGNPITRGLIPLLTLDVWEHAYYLDYQSKRPQYTDAFLQKHINWTFAEDNLEKALRRAPL